MAPANFSNIMKKYTANLHCFQGGSYIYINLFISLNSALSSSFMDNDSCDDDNMANNDKSI